MPISIKKLTQQQTLRTPKGAIRRAHQYAGKEANNLLKGRFRIIKSVPANPVTTRDKSQQ
jgi:hypothetical protein